MYKKDKLVKNILGTTSSEMLLLRSHIDKFDSQLAKIKILNNFFMYIQYR